MANEILPDSKQAFLEGYDTVAARLIELGDPDTAAMVTVLKKTYISANEHNQRLNGLIEQFADLAQRAIA